MKIILLENVKGKGKKGQVVEQPNGYANFLIRGNKALPATDENMKVLEEKQAVEEAAEAKLIQKMKEVKTFVEEHPVKIKAKSGKDGRMFGSVSTKQIVSEYQKQFDIKLDKKKFKSTEALNALGTYKLEIDLHKDVQAIVTVIVGE